MMAVFKDMGNREWKLSITVRQLRVVRETTGFDLGRLLDDDLKRFREIAEDPVLLFRVLFVLVSAQAESLKIDFDTFAESMAGDVLADAWDAFVAAYADFCPGRRRNLLLTLARRMKEVSEQVTATVEQRLQETTAEASNRPVGDSPESAGSIPPG